MVVVVVVVAALVLRERAREVITRRCCRHGAAGAEATRAVRHWIVYNWYMGFSHLLRGALVGIGHAALALNMLCQYILHVDVCSTCG